MEKTKNHKEGKNGTFFKKTVTLLYCLIVKDFWNYIFTVSTKVINTGCGESSIFLKEAFEETYEIYLGRFVLVYLHTLGCYLLKAKVCCLLFTWMPEWMNERTAQFLLNVIKIRLEFAIKLAQNCRRIGEDAGWPGFEPWISFVDC